MTHILSLFCWTFFDIKNHPHAFRIESAHWQICLYTWLTRGGWSRDAEHCVLKPGDLNFTFNSKRVMKQLQPDLKKDSRGVLYLITYAAEVVLKGFLTLTTANPTILPNSWDIEPCLCMRVWYEYDCVSIREHSQLGKYNCTADLQCDWFGFEQTSKMIVIQNKQSNWIQANKQEVSHTVILPPMVSVLWLKHNHTHTNPSRTAGFHVLFYHFH